MQDRTINNALLALVRAGGDQAIAAEIILVMRGVDLPTRIQDRPLSRGQCRRIILGCLPCTTAQAGEAIQAYVGGVTRRAANNRAYQALLRLEVAGVVVRDFGPDGCLWRIKGWKT